MGIILTMTIIMTLMMIRITTRFMITIMRAIIC